MLEQNTEVEGYAGTKSRIGRELNGVQFLNGENSTYAEFFQVGVNYPEVLGLRLKAGRLFKEELDSDLQNALVVNEAFLDALSVEFNPDGKQILQDSIEYTIVGVVENFHYWAPSRRIRGDALKVIPPSEYSAFTMKMNEGNILEQRDEMTQDLEEIVTDRYVGIDIQEMIFENYFEEMKGIRNVMLFTASIAILLASMGLYGLVNINVTSHLKDFGIRKVLGANGFSIA